MLEKMSDFFKARLDGYDEHMLTVKHGITALSDAGFSKVEILHNWGAAYCIKSITKQN